MSIPYVSHYMHIASTYKTHQSSNIKVTVQRLFRIHFNVAQIFFLKFRLVEHGYLFSDKFVIASVKLYIFHIGLAGLSNS